MTQYFVTDVVVLFCWSITVQTRLLWPPGENLSWYTVLDIFNKVTRADYIWRFFVP